MKPHQISEHLGRESQPLKHQLGQTHHPFGSIMSPLMIAMFCVPVSRGAEVERGSGD